MKSLTLEQMENAKGGKFIGTVTKCSDCISGHKFCKRQDYFFWIKVGSSTWEENCSTFNSLNVVQ